MPSMQLSPKTSPLVPLPTSTGEPRTAVERDKTGSENQIAEIIAHLGLRYSSERSKRYRINPKVWEHKEMRRALVQRDIGTIYRLLQRHGIPQRVIAAMTNQSQSDISEILLGRRVGNYDVLVRIAVGLGIPRGWMGLAYDATREGDRVPFPSRRLSRR